MKKSEWALVFIPLLFTLLVDQATKSWAEQLLYPKMYNPLILMLHHNHGAMLGLFSDLPAVLRIVSLSTGGAFLLATYALVQYLLPIKSILLRSGASFLIGGILGNVLDRILHGYVIDFIIFKFGNWVSPAFNPADALQWVGYFMIGYVIIKENEILWPENEFRKARWVNIGFQLKYCFILMGVSLSISLISLVFSYTFLKVTILDISDHNQSTVNKFLLPYALTYAVMGMAFCLILFWIGRIISSRIAGPLYAFERFLDKTLKGEPYRLKLRSGDEFKHLEELSIQISERLKVIKDERTVQVIEYKDDDV